MKKAQFLHTASFAEVEVRSLRVGRRLWIGPAGEAAPREDVLPIWLGNGPAFGTGAHPTTELCLRVLDRHLQPGARVLDLGTGTGILAVAAARLGAETVLGVDLDPGAVAVAQANVMRNGVQDRVRVERGTLADMLGGADAQFDWVVTNILAHVIVEFFDQGLTRVLAPGGWVALSGFLRSQTPLIRAGILPANLELLAQEQNGEWICIIVRKPLNNPTAFPVSAT